MVILIKWFICYWLCVQLSIYGVHVPIVRLFLSRVRLPQWAITEEPSEAPLRLTRKHYLAPSEETGEDGPTPPKRPRLTPPAPPRPCPKSKKPLLKQPVSLQRLAALSLVSHSNWSKLHG
jgi:hypothetical protein